MTVSNASHHKFLEQAALTHHSRLMRSLEDSIMQPPLQARFSLVHKPVLKKFVCIAVVTLCPKTPHQHPFMAA